MGREDDDLDDNVDTMGLSDEEKAAIAGDDDDGDDLKDIADADIDDDGDDGDDGDGDNGDEPDTKQTKPAADKAEAQADASDDAGDDDEDDKIGFVPLMHVEKIENYDEQMKAFTDQLAELDQKLESGDIDLKDYTVGIRSVTEKQTDLQMKKLTADNQIKQNESIKVQLWQSQQEEFFEQSANKIYGENSMLFSALNTKLKELAQVPENANKSGFWFLKEADREVRKLIGQTADNKQAKRKADLTGIPKTLGSLPAADNSETSDNEFAHLDNLSGMELEAALAKMPQEKADRYLRA